LCGVVADKKQPDFKWERNVDGKANVKQVAYVKNVNDTTGNVNTIIAVRDGRSMTQFFFPANGVAKTATKLWARVCLIQDTTQTKDGLLKTLTDLNGTVVADSPADPVFNVTGMEMVTDAEVADTPGLKWGCRQKVVVEVISLSAVDPVPEGRRLMYRPTLNGKMALLVKAPPKKPSGKKGPPKPMKKKGRKAPPSKGKKGRKAPSKQMKKRPRKPAFRPRKMKGKRGKKGKNGSGQQAQANGASYSVSD